ncbi:MAG: calcium-binding protein [Nostoc sp. DedQUE11]|nr:calcium-binding protein [Nostoc sp. DedQUE11]
MVTKFGTNFNDNGTIQNGIFYPTLTGTDGNDSISGLAGNDIIDGAAGNDSLWGDGGNDLLRGGDGIDWLSGGDGNDTIIGDRGNDIFVGGAGNDRLIWNNGDGSDKMSGNAGYDVVEVNGAAAAGDTFRLQADAQGRAIFDRLNLVPFTLTVDTAEKFEVNGQGGDDIFDVNSLAGTSIASVQFTGGAGNDLLDGADTATPLVGYGNDGNDTLKGGAGTDSLSGDAGNDLLRGGDGIDWLSGGDGNDTIIGDRGNDIFVGGAGNDRLIWNNGDGSDKMSGNAGYDVIEVNGAGAAGDTFRLQADAQGRAIFDRLNLVPFTLTVDTAEKFEVNGQGGDDIFDVNSLAGTSIASVQFTGGAGNDLLDGADTATPLVGYGNDGNDTLKGGAGTDSLSGDAGNDLLRGGDGIDWLSGGDGNDTIIGDRGNDIFVGGAGNDRLIWNNGDGSDKMSGNAGYDVVEVNGAAAAGDTFRLQADAQGRAIFDRLNLVPFTLTVDTAERFEVNGQGGDDIFDVNSLAGTSITSVQFTGGAGNDLLDGRGTSTPLVGYGNEGNDILYGGSGNDSLYGDAGNDYLAGGKGNDVLSGGLGADKFYFESKLNGIDIIKDFQYAQGDKIQVSKIGFGASNLSQFSYNNITGGLSYQGQLFATVENKPAGFSISTDVVLI